MHFSKKTGAAVLAIAAASAIALPGAAFAATYTTTGGSNPAVGATTFTNTNATGLELILEDEDVIDLSGNNTLVDIDINTDACATSGSVTLPDNFSGYLTFTNVANMDKVTVKCNGSTLSIGTAAVHYAMGEGEIAGVLTDGDATLTTSSDDADVIEDFIDMAHTSSLITDLTTVSMSSNDLETIDLSDLTEVTSLTINGSDLTDIDGLDQVGTDAGGTVMVDITAADLTSIDFGNNDSMLDLMLDTDLEVMNLSGLENMIGLDVSGSSDLMDLDLTDADELMTLNISNTKLAALDLSDTKVASGTLTADNIEIDDQYATVSTNEDDDDFNDYMFDLDNITGGMAEFIASGESNFTVVDSEGTPYAGNVFDTSDEDDFDYDDGTLTVTDEKAPTAIKYMVLPDNDSTTLKYEVSFDVSEVGERIAGVDRYDTMIQINTDSGDMDLDQQFSGATDVVVASGAGYVDALSASALAGALDTAVVTTAVDSMTNDTLDMLDDMSDQGTAYIVGGTSAVSYTVEQQLSNAGFSIKRFAGVDRFDTAVKVQDNIQDMVDDGDVSDSKTVIITTGVNYADALTIAPYAYTQNMPIVLVGADGMMDTQTANLFNKYKNDYSKAIIVGGTAVVSNDVVDILEGYDMDVIRLAGDDRFETNLVINNWLDRGSSSISTSDSIFKNAGYSKDDIDDFNDSNIHAMDGANDYDGTAYVATGLGFADALAAAPLAGLKNGTMNLVSDSDISTVTEAKDNDASTTIIGGTAVISENLADAIDDL